MQYYLSMFTTHLDGPLYTFITFPVSLNGSKGLYRPVMLYYFGTLRNLAGYLYIAALAI